MPWQRPNRLWRHIITDEAAARRMFSESVLDHIEKEIVAGEAIHRGQVCVAIEPTLPLSRILKRVSPRERALEVFGLLRVWDTEENNGVLLYFLIADHDFEIVADRAIHARVGEEAWEAICKHMEQAFREGRFIEGIEQGVREVSALLAAHFPGDARDRNEIPDRPILL